MSLNKDLGVGGLVGLLAGLGLVSWVQPTTNGGVGLLLCVCLALGIVVGWIVSAVGERSRRRRAPPSARLSVTRTDRKLHAMASRFQVFLSHNSRDKAEVRNLKELLEAKGIVVWYDEEQLVPGYNWQPLLEKGIEDCASGAVIVGRDGLGPWEDEEMQVLLRCAVEAGKPVIPVLLPDAPEEPTLPAFLRNRTWVDLRSGSLEDALNNLVWGITGQKPNARTRYP